jgi:hypothetical protein
MIMVTLMRMIVEMELTSQFMENMKQISTLLLARKATRE